MHRRAFTLMELLLVVAIIALLVALLLPVFQQARKKSYEPVCTSNLRQFYVAFSLYREDYGDAPKYQVRLLPYIKDKRILRCPADPTKSGIAWFEASGIISGPLLETSYIFFRPFCDSFRDIMARHDPNHGIAVCVVHGEVGSPLRPPSPLNYTGKLLRLRLDGSVQIAHALLLCHKKPEEPYPSAGRHGWLDYTDIRPIPQEVLDTWVAFRGEQVWECR